MNFEYIFYTILISIIGALLSDYIKPHLNTFFSYISNSYKNRVNRKREERNKNISEIASDGTLLQLCAMKCYFFDTLFFLCLIVFIVTPPTSFILMLLSLSYGLLSMVAGYRGRQARKILNEATELYKQSVT
jgi:hypothetical protein